VEKKIKKEKKLSIENDFPFQLTNARKASQDSKQAGTRENININSKKEN